MKNISRRDALTSLAAAGIAATTQLAAAAPHKPQPAVRTRLTPTQRSEATATLLEYFSKVGPLLFREPAGLLKYPSMSPSIPGKAYSNELWDWDTYWTAIGLFELARLRNDSALHAAICTHLHGAVMNFFDHQGPDGKLPIMLSSKNPDLFGSTAPGKNPHNQAKPVLAQMALLLSDETKDAQWFAPCFDKLLKFYDSWEANNQSQIGLLVWGNDVAAGTDNDPSTFGRPLFSSAAIFLNSFYYRDLRAAETLATRLNRNADATKLGAMAKRIGDAIQQHCWDPRDRFYYTADVQCTDERSKWLPGLPQGMAMSWKSIPIRIEVNNGFLPLWCELATKEQAKQLIEAQYLQDDRFRANYGVRSVSNRETMYSLTPHSGNPSNWLGPVWIVSNYWTWKGLKNYGYEAEARELADKTLTLLHRDMKTTGTLNEYYHPDTGAPLSHQGFIDWNLLVLAMV